MYWFGARQTVALQDIADRLIGNHISEIGKGPRNPETVPRPEYQDLRQTRPPCATLASADRRVTRPEESGHCYLNKAFVNSLLSFLDHYAC